MQKEEQPIQDGAHQENAGGNQKRGSLLRKRLTLNIGGTVGTCELFSTVQIQASNSSC